MPPTPRPRPLAPPRTGHLLGVALAGTLAALAALAAASPALSQEPSGEELDGMIVTRDVDYVPDEEYADGRDLLDVYMPPQAAGAPVVVFFHGGQLTRGDKSQGEHLARQLVPQGIGVVSANYRLSPQVMHPAHVQDASAAVAWSAENIEGLGGHPERLFVAGHSAGAYLAVLLALDPAHLEAHSLSPDFLRGVISISPFLFVEETAPDRPKTVWGEDPAAWLEASVTPHIEGGKPPMLLIYADGDAVWRKQQIDLFAVQMVAAGNEKMSVVQVANRNHGSLLTSMGEADDQVGQRTVRFVQREAY